MTKLEEKLIQLGYYKKSEHYSEHYENHSRKLTIYHKDVTEFVFIEFRIFDPRCTRKYRGRVVPYEVETQEDINEIQQAFNQLQKDLEVLKEC